MIRNYFKIAFRSLWYNKSMSAINFLGLTLGLTSSLLIFLWISDEISVDRYHANGHQIYRLMWRQISEGKRMAMGSTPGPTSVEFKKKYPEIVRASVFTARSKAMTFQVGDKVGKETGDWAGPEWFKMFSIRLLVGSTETALKAPYSISISRKLAQTYFGNVQSAIGKSIRIENKEEFQVTSVFENLPENTSQKYNFLLPWDDFTRQMPWAKEWGNPSPCTLVQLRTDTDITAFDAKIKHALRGYLGINSKNAKQFDVELFLQPYEDIYLHSETDNGEISGGRIDYIRLLSIVGVVVLLIACINFMNLSTAQSAKRAKEVGVRKAVGADRWRLIIQFIGEALLLTLGAAFASLGLIMLLLPGFNQLTGKTIVMPFTDFNFAMGMLIIVAVTGILAGSYPALYLSSLRPISVLKGILKSKRSATVLREALVVIQFTISIALIIGTFVVHRQMSFINKKNLGFDRENLIYVPMEGALLERYGTLKQELQHMQGIQGFSRMDYQPSSISSGTTQVDWTGKDPSASIEFAQVSVGYDMDSVLKMKLQDGRYFSEALASDSAGFVINEQAARRIGYKNPVGQPLTLWGKPGKILGVMKDFHFQSLREPVKPLIMWFGENNKYGNLLVRTQPGQTRQALLSLEAVCKKLNPSFVFTYNFADQEYEKMYKSEQVVSTLGNYFAVLSIFIACLGLFGLASFMAQQRIKEIGIRKVLGATVIGIVKLLSKDFLRLVFIALLIACPAAWWAMDKWLNGFTYKEQLSWWIFAVTGGSVIAVAFLTVSFQSVRAALLNPVKSLKSE
ncbi:ABC transporter permease [Dyadobacter frigoris]|uniref:ABC transporter permease n=1 Tax=Dyadobacter frigoris TaxID=2576211 RepID=UPI0024A3E869|nr:ABC transporter permease [Dyadobacter frigoris]GLU52628.1 ABC transporter permease [Dyadobacter frigoris]